MKRNTILFVIALVAAIAFAGSAQAGVTVTGQVNSTAAQGEIVTLWLDVNPSDYTTVAVIDADPYKDYYWFSDLTPMLDRNGYTSGTTGIPVTVAMYCSGTERDIDGVSGSSYNNVDRNVTVVHGSVDYADGTYSMSLMELETCPVPGYVDLNVTEILLNPGDKRATDIPRIYVNDVNNISAVVWNYGTEAAGAFDVCFKDDLNGVTIGSVTVAGLAAGSSTMVSIPDWTPTCADYNVQPGFPSQSLPITINVTADCNSEVSESDETNNTLLKHVPAIMPCSGYALGVISGVVNNGYRSKNFDCNTAEPLDEFMQPTDWIVGGGVEYNVSGVKTSSAEGYFPPQDTRTRVHQIDLPSGAGVVDARLYVYAADKGMGTKDYPTGCLPNLVVNFESTDLTTPDVVYADTKGFGKYLGPKATTVFDVTSLVSGSGSYTAIVKNDEPAGGNTSTLLGEMLVVVYEGADHGDEVKIWMLEGVDYLVTMDKRNGHGYYDYSVSPYESTATVGFGGILNKNLVETADLTAVVFYGGKPGENLLFNGNTVMTDAWLTEAYPGSEVRVANVPVENYLSASGNNNMGFEDDLPADTTGGFNAAGAFLVVTKGKEPNATVFFEPSDSGADYNDIATVSVWVNTSDVIKGGNLYFDYTVGCADVIGYTPNDVDWDFINQADLSVAGKVSIGFGTLDVLGRGPGLLHIGDLDIKCCNVAYCETDLVWNSTSKLNRLAGGLVDPLKLEDGTFTCTNLPDLDVTKVYGEQQTGDDYIVHYTVENIGNADAAAGHTATLYIGESATPGVWTWIEDMTVPDALAPGEFYEGTFNTTLTMTIPNDLMKVCADTGDDVMELDEDNNCMESFYPAGIEIKVVAPDGCVDFQEQFTVDINVDPRNIETYGVQYTLSFNNEVLHAEWQNEGIFLKGDGMGTNVYINTIDNGAGTISYAATRTGTPDGVIVPGTLATIKFTAIQQGADTNLNLSDIVVSNNLGNEILPVDDINDTVCVWENMPPVASGKSMHKYNNDGQKYICKVYFNATDSYDEDGEIVNYRWSFGDGNYGTGDMKDHIYLTWKWNTLTEEYDPFNASITVTDDGDPHQLDDTMFFDVIVYTAGDANGDGKVNILDATIVGLEWGDTAEFDGDLYWHNDERGSKADLNNDCKVNILDAVIVGTCWGHVAW